MISTAEKTDLIYLPPPRPEIAQSDFDNRLRAIAGEAPTGETMIRFRWGMDCKEMWGKDEVYKYPDDSEPAKYVGLPFFVLEGWQSSDVYDRLEWKQNEDVLGDFPERGVWDLIEVLRGDEGETIPLGSRALELAESWKFWRSKGHKRALSALLEKRARRRELQDKRFADAKAKILDTYVEDFVRIYESPEHTAYSFNKKITGEQGFKTTESGLYIPN